MEKIKINDFYFFNDPDISELDLLINADKPQPAISVPINDDTDEKYDVYLRVDPETYKIVGATIMYSDNLFQGLARAFANKDLIIPTCVSFSKRNSRRTRSSTPTNWNPRPRPCLRWRRTFH